MSSSTAAAATGAPTAAAGAPDTSNLADLRYSFDTDALAKLRSDVPWMKDPKYFQKVAVSPSAIMKIIMHCQSGVKKGIAKGGNPIEVMGMLLGRPDPITPQTLVVVDAFPLPIEGFETRVIADDENVVNHMIELGESLERTRKEKFMGWYHSHPFDIIPEYSHCFLSQTDLSTQLQWQRAEDPHGNPFVAIVVDPLRSIHLDTPQLKAFRAYPPEYNSPTVNECPDGTIQHNESLRLQQWGSCWNRYYELEIEYYMSQTSRSILEQLTQDYLWMRTLCKKDVDLKQQLVNSKRLFIHAANAAATSPSNTNTPGTATGASTAGGGSGGAASSSSSTGGGTSSGVPISRWRNVGGGGGGGSEPGLASLGSQQQQQQGAGSGSNSANTKSTELSKAVQYVVDIASEQIRHAALEKTKDQVFCPPPAPVLPPSATASTSEEDVMKG